MTTSNLRTAILLALSMMFIYSGVLAQRPCPFRAPVGESSLRKQKATKKVKPLYPEASLKKNVAGRVVVGILVDERGKVTEAKVKEAPDELTGQAVVDAAKQWEFQAPPKIQGRQICLESTLSFKFDIKNGKGNVTDDPAN